MRLIDADALVKEISVSHTMTDDYGIKTGCEISMRLVEDAPTIKPKTGHWIESNPMNSADARLITCSECGNTYIVGMSLLLEEWADGRNYCIRCGAKMEVTK